MWIVNDITDCKTCLFHVSGLFVLFCFRILFVSCFRSFCFILFQDSMCEDVFICLSACVHVFCVCGGVNSHACYRRIVNDITDCKSCLFYV